MFVKKCQAIPKLNLVFYWTNSPGLSILQYRSVVNTLRNQPDLPCFKTCLYGSILITEKPTQFLALLDFSKQTGKKRYDFPISILPTCISLNVKFSIPTKSRKLYTFFSLLDQ